VSFVEVLSDRMTILAQNSIKSDEVSGNWKAAQTVE
jgi:hypothetical protein